MNSEHRSIDGASPGGLACGSFGLSRGSSNGAHLNRERPLWTPGGAGDQGPAAAVRERAAGGSRRWDGAGARRQPRAGAGRRRDAQAVLLRRAGRRQRRRRHHRSAVPPRAAAAGQEHPAAGAPPSSSRRVVVGVSASNTRGVPTVSLRGAASFSWCGHNTTRSPNASGTERVASCAYEHVRRRGHMDGRRLWDRRRLHRGAQRSLRAGPPRFSAERGDDGVGDDGHLGEPAERVLAALLGDNGGTGRPPRVQGDHRRPCGGGQHVRARAHLTP